MAHPAHKDDQFDLSDIDPKLISDLEPKLLNLMQQSEALVALMRDFFHKLDKHRSDEFKIIAGYIQKAKEEIREMRPHDISHDRIPTAGAELEAITKDTEDATHTIMEAAESIMGFESTDDAYKAKVDDEVMKIFEACSFQDITGQRVTKVVNVLKQIEERVGKLANTLGVEDKPVPLTAEEIRRRDLLLNGPAIGGPEVKQDAIDAMFDGDFDSISVDDAVASPAPQVSDSAASSEAQSQDDIDAMFSADPVAEDTAEEGLDMGKTNSQDDIDALFG